MSKNGTGRRGTRARGTRLEATRGPETQAAGMSIAEGPETVASFESGATAKTGPGRAARQMG